MNRTIPALGPAVVVALVLVVWAIFRVPAKTQSSVPSLPVMGTLGLGILVGGIAIGTLIYLWKRSK